MRQRLVHAALAPLLLCSVCFASERARPASENPLVQIDSGLIQGTHAPDTPELVFFRGIPYAAPPVGELRWRPPQPPASWSGTRKAEQLSAACPQTDFLYRGIQRTLSSVGGDPSLVNPVGKTGEDCLYLNVITAGLHDKALRPVMVWIHGGGGVGGRGDDDGATLALKGVVVVTMNYRLGVFGWFSHPALTAESPHQSSGNYGLLDQLAALQWVRSNIAQFGGDPANITIFGHSSGGEYVGCLMVSPLASGLFQRAIMQSGVPFDLLASVHHPGGEVESAEKQGLEFAQKLGAGKGAPSIQTLRSVSADELLKAADGVGFEPVDDGWVLPEQPLRKFTRHEQADVPLIVGGTAREFTNLVGPDKQTPETFRDWMKKNYGPVADDVLSTYGIPTQAHAKEALIRAVTDLEMLAPARWAAQAMQGKKSNAYLYELTWAYPTQGGQHVGAFHGMDPWLMFDSPHVPRDAAGEGLADALREYWTQFARTGDPNVQALPKWPPYEPATALYLELGAVIRTGAHSHQSAFALVERLYASRLSSIHL